MNYSYMTTMYESILAQMFVFLALFTTFAHPSRVGIYPAHKC